MNTTIIYFSHASTDTGRVGALFNGVLDEDWVQPHTIFDPLFSSYSLLGSYKFDIIQPSLREGAPAFFQGATP